MALPELPGLTICGHNLALPGLILCRAYRAKPDNTGHYHVQPLVGHFPGILNTAGYNLLQVNTRHHWVRSFCQALLGSKGSDALLVT